MTKYLPSGALIFLAALGAFLAFRKGVGKKIGLIGMLMLILMWATGIIGFWVKDLVALPGQILYFISAAIFALLGTVYQGITRSIFTLPSFPFKMNEVKQPVVFSLKIWILGLLGFFAVFFFFLEPGNASDRSWGMVFFLASLTFFVPALLATASSVISSMERPIFEKKWHWDQHDSPIPEEYMTLEQDYSVRIHIKVAYSLKGDKGLMPYRKRITIRRAPTIRRPLSEVFRYTIEAYNRRIHEKQIQDLGYERELPDFWWLFKVEPAWWNILSFFLPPRYLDPERSLSENGVKRNDVIVAIRQVDK